jgi:hypothetical protein
MVVGGAMLDGATAKLAMACREWHLAGQAWFGRARVELLCQARSAGPGFNLDESSAVSVRAQLAVLRRALWLQLRRIAGVVGKSFDSRLGLLEGVRVARSRVPLVKTRYFGITLPKSGSEN